MNQNFHHWTCRRPAISRFYFKQRHIPRQSRKLAAWVTIALCLIVKSACRAYFVRRVSRFSLINSSRVRIIASLMRITRNGQTFLSIFYWKRLRIEQGTGCWNSHSTLEIRFIYTYDRYREYSLHEQHNEWFSYLLRCRVFAGCVSKTRNVRVSEACFFLEFFTCKLITDVCGWGPVTSGTMTSATVAARVRDIQSRMKNVINYYGSSI